MKFIRVLLCLLASVSFEFTVHGHPCGNNRQGGPSSPNESGHNEDDTKGKGKDPRDHVNDEGSDPVTAYGGNEYRTITDLTLHGAVGKEGLSFKRHSTSRYISGGQFFGHGAN
ncbi:MAG TPA: hypothetical protein VIT91_20855, partial [Chthoniobacterales bacterium]